MSIDIKTKIADLKSSEVYSWLLAYYSKKSIFNIINKEREESVHSDMIAWLLSPNESHGLSFFPLSRFLLLLAIAEQNEINRESKLDFKDQFLIDDYKIHGATIAREKAIIVSGKSNDGKDVQKNGRLDIFIEIDISINGKRKTLPIIIENKVCSKENHVKELDCMQTDFYHMWGDMNFNDTNVFFSPIYVFLQPSYLDYKPAHNKDFINLFYQEYLDIVMEPCRLRITSPENRNRLTEYIRSLSYSDLTNIDSSREKKEKIVMAFSSEEKKYLKLFFENNKDLLVSMATCLGDDDDISDEDKDALKKFASVAKDYSKYEFKGHEYGKGRLVLAVVQDYVEANSGKLHSFSDLEKAFPNNLNTTYGVVKEENEIKSQHLGKGGKYKRYFIKEEDHAGITFSKGPVLVCKEWGKGQNFDRFLKHATEELKYTITKCE